MADNTQSFFYPPVIAVLGHVDHGKTTLLDTIRKTSIAEREHGGITQKIGASSISLMHDNQKRTITFIDTPGHEAFAKMRGRGAQAADMGLLVVSAADSVMPQTRESIQLLLQERVPFIVVITKIDLPTANVAKVKQQLLQEGVLLEGMGGDVPVIEVSAKENRNIKELLELILLVKELYASTFANRSENGSLKAIVIESKLDPKIGPKATVVVKNGTIAVKDEISCEDIAGKVRTLITDTGEHSNKASVGEAVEVLGFAKVPPVGALVFRKGEEVKVEKQEKPQEEISVPTTLNPLDFFANIEEQSVFSLILCADTQGSLEAIINALPKEVKIILQKTGDVTPADILMAKSANAIVLSFNSKLRSDILRLAMQEKVLLKNYTIIYELIDEVKDVLEGKQLAMEEKIYGKAKILASFPFEKTKVLGVIVMEGRIAKGDKIRLMRGDDVLGEATLGSLRQGKNSTSKVEKGSEAGVILQPPLDFQVGDMIVCHN